jgi:DNA gyrase inhibitor GyrI
MTRAPAKQQHQLAVRFALKHMMGKLKNSRDYKSTLKQFKEFIDKKDKLPQHSITYFIYYDLDDLVFKMASELQIPHNTMVLVRGVVPSKLEKKEEKRIEDYRFDWMGGGAPSSVKDHE